VSFSRVMALVVVCVGKLEKATIVAKISLNLSD